MQSVAEENKPYPVLDSATLHPVHGTLFRPRRRSPEEMPKQVPGSVWVFQNGDHFTAAEAGREFGLPDVVDAVTVLVVSMRTELVTTRASFRWVNRPEILILTASFRCRVYDPIEALESGCFDIHPYLQSHLVDDGILQMVATRTDLESDPQVLQRLLARMLARRDVNDVIIPGVTIRLLNVQLYFQREQEQESRTILGVARENGMDAGSRPGSVTDDEGRSAGDGFPASAYPVDDLPMSDGFPASDYPADGFPGDRDVDIEGEYWERAQ